MNSKSFVLSAYLSLNAERDMMVLDYMGAARPAIEIFSMAAHNPRLGNDRRQLPKAVRHNRQRSLGEMKTDFKYPHNHEVIISGTDGYIEEDVCRVLTRFFGKTPEQARIIFNAASRKDAVSVNSYPLDVACTKVDDARDYARKNRLLVPTLAVKI